MEQGFAGGVFSVLRARITRLQQDVVVAKDLWGAEAERKKGDEKTMLSKQKAPRAGCHA